MDAVKKLFGHVNDREVYAYTLKNDHGMEITCIEYGCAILSIKVPDRSGQIENVVMGCSSLEDYLHKVPYFGAVVGRVGGRIAKGDLPVGGQHFRIAANQEGNHLHGGKKGFSHRIWSSEAFKSEHEARIEFTYFSPDGEEGYPGNLTVKVTYVLTNDNELVLSYEGEADQDTVLNMTNHTYFNLSGGMKDSVREHTLVLPSSRFLELDQESLPTGEALKTEGTVFDFRHGRMLQEGLDSTHEQIAIAGGGYDHPFLLDEGNVMTLYDEKSGRFLEAETNQPAVIVYTGNSMDSDIILQEGISAGKHMAVCLETQFPPDAVHHPSFPSIELAKGEKYHHYTKWSFSVK
ncbi:galactose mutarotase [Bacillus sp. FJAT-42376]|uniref:aldose epimerase family protein n=1 Tax=Bacillus sp. FJAT-42376 TaxID=2014076 RepID=UPI000F508366|nr:aldose epimerase family protein [Bacillus sp. FJAT-42376]AZB42699.1 galactose mutarotase [Bacillus sp. FJAT-42376]